ncbi:hypothetical protein [Halodesulfovibrio sp.]|jgi:hypothetical protein|uniref:hypothetical protein n=1 Tax=Halodesulfovibrio sp. TaxID=1912772 RepID=UPI0025E8A5D0|nr:hypothetical protein [Halodesulfovibrio sp.]MCT4533915.1 hypothetical protein [Halodesulfovibrio sp.]MCT4628147.1 hypothetical protein [Halodesulfovibrio sp.]
MFQEAKLHLYIHPAIQITGIVFGYIALYWGMKRFLKVHNDMSFLFPWKRHVLFGKIAVLLWTIGIGVGIYYTHAEWNNYRLTEEHYRVGMASIPLLLATFVSGYWMDVVKKKRQSFCVAHGVVGLFLCVLVFIQIITGIQVFFLFVW